MTITTDQVLRHLREVPEPCSLAMRNPMNICEMGLVESVTIEAGRVCVELCLTDPGCVHFRSLQQYITDVLLVLEGVDSVSVTQTTRMLWTPDRVFLRTVEP